MTPKKWFFVLLFVAVVITVAVVLDLQLNGGASIPGFNAGMPVDSATTTEEPTASTGLVFEPIPVPAATPAVRPLNEQMFVLGDHVRERGMASTDGSILKVWEAGEAVRVVGEKNGWYLLDDGGYVRADLLTKNFGDIVPHMLEQHSDLIVVFKSAQRVEYWYDNQLVVSGDCVTGDTLKGYDTPIGLYWITSRETGKTLVADGIEYPTDWYCAFNAGNGYMGFHNAPWRHGIFGGNQYKTGSGSHGCVNCPDDLAATIYAACKVGLTYVLILP